MLAAEAGVVENELVRHQPLHGVHGLLAGSTGFFHLGPQAEGLWRDSARGLASSAHPFLPNTTPRGLPWSAARCWGRRRLWLPAGEGQSGHGQLSDAPDFPWGHQPRSQGTEGGGARVEGKHRSSPLHPQARHLPGVSSHPAGHLHERGWPGRLLQPGTWLMGSDGGPGRDAAPAGFCKGKSVGQAPQALPRPAGWGCLQTRGVGGCGWDFPSVISCCSGSCHFRPSPPPSPASPPRCSPGAGGPEWNHVLGPVQSG